MFAQPVTYQSYDNEPVQIASSLSLRRRVLVSGIFFLVELEFLTLDI